MKKTFVLLVTCIATCVGGSDRARAVKTTTVCVAGSGSAKGHQICTVFDNGDKQGSWI